MNWKKDWGVENIIPCDICDQPTSFERDSRSLPTEGEHTTCCDSWVCADCVCWVETDEAQTICKDCCKCYISEYGTHWKVSDSYERRRNER